MFLQAFGKGSMEATFKVASISYLLVVSPLKRGLRTWKKILKFDKYSACIVLLFLVLIGLRSLHITADPPADLSWSGGLFFDEGALAHNARNQVLFGQWKMDEWNDFYYSPLLSYLKWMTFALLGVGMWQLRLVSLVFTTGTLAALYFSLKVAQDRLTAALGLLLLGGNYLYLMYSRLGLTEISVVFLTVLTLYFWILGMVARTAWKRRLWMILAGAACFTVYIFKALMIYFLPVPIVSLALFWLFPGMTFDRKRLLSMMGWCLAGMIMAAGLWLWLFYLPNYEPIHQAGDYVKMLSLPNSPEDFTRNIARTPFFDIFLQTPVHLVLALGYFVYLLYLLLHDRTRLSPLDMFAGFWFLAHLAFFLGYSYRPTRYYVPIIPAMSILAVRAIAGMLRVPALKISMTRLSRWFWVGCWLIISVVWGLVLLPLGDRYNLFQILTIPEFDENVFLIAGAVLALGCVLAAMWWLRHYAEAVTSVSAKGIAILLIAGFLWINGIQYYQWAKEPSFTIRDISRELGEMLENAFLAGLPTPMLSMENTHRALYVWENFTNYQHTFQRYPITHLFLAEFNGEVDYYDSKFPDVMQRARLLKTYSIKGSQFYLFSVIEPSIEDLQVERESLRADQPVQIRFEIVNNDPRQAKVLEPGIMVFPENSRQPIVRAQERVTLEPQAQTDSSFSQQLSPGRYHVLAAIFPEQADRHEVEDLLSQGGVVTVDPEGSGGNVRMAPPEFSGFLTYGPYRQYPAGHYTVEFRLKFPALPVEENVPLATLDVSADTGQRLLAQQIITLNEIEKIGRYQPFQMTFALEDPHILEFRIATHGQVEIWADTVKVSYVPGVWYPAPIVVQPTE